MYLQRWSLHVIRNVKNENRNTHIWYQSLMWQKKGHCPRYHHPAQIGASEIPGQLLYNIFSSRQPQLFFRHSVYMTWFLILYSTKQCFTLQTVLVSWCPMYIDGRSQNTSAVTLPLDNTTSSVYACSKCSTCLKWKLNINDYFMTVFHVSSPPRQEKVEILFKTGGLYPAELSCIFQIYHKTFLQLSHMECFKAFFLSFLRNWNRCCQTHHLLEREPPHFSETFMTKVRVNILLKPSIH